MAPHVHAFGVETIRLFVPVLEQIEKRDRSLGDPMRRALASVALNLNEGIGHRRGNRRLRFETARGSAKESLAAYEVAAAFGYIALDEALAGSTRSNRRDDLAPALSGTEDVLRRLFSLFRTRRDARTSLSRNVRPDALTRGGATAFQHPGENMREARAKVVEPLIVEGRVPPHDLDAEAAVLSAVMLDTSALDKVLEFLKPEHFYSEAHRRVFEAAIELRSVGQPVDVVQVGTWLKNRERIAQVGGMAYLTELLNAAPAVSNVAAYGRTIHEKWRVRQLIATCQRVAAQGYLDYGEAQQYIDGAEQDIYQIARTPESSSVEKLLDVMKKSFKALTEAMQRGDRITGTPSGFDRYDRLTAGLHPGDLSIVAARPGMGKTSFVLNVATNVASPRGRETAGEAAGHIPGSGAPGADKRWDEPGVGVAVFSLEMPREQIANRMLCSEARVDVGKLRQGHLSPQDWSKLTQAASYLGSLPIWIDDTPSLSILELRAKVRRLQAEFDRPDPTGGRANKRLGLVVVDYLQLMKGRDGVQSREQEISEISRGLKGLAKELHLPVIALSQLNRAVETRSEKSKRPQLSDLRESGAIEQDADNIVFIYRDEYYNREATTEPNVAELIIAKQRNGPTGTAKVRFDHAYTRFDNLADGEFEE